MNSSKKLRVIVRPWIPQKVPIEITKNDLQEFIQENVGKFKSVIYMGWIRRKVQGKRVMKFILATADKASEARNKFKKSEEFGEDVWDLTESQNSIR